MNDIIIVPIFDINDDEEALFQIGNLFKGKSIQALNSNDIAYNGGVLNCISWNIKR